MFQQPLSEDSLQQEQPKEATRPQDRPEESASPPKKSWLWTGIIAVIAVIAVIAIIALANIGGNSGGGQGNNFPKSGIIDGLIDSPTKP